jgi:alcohol dehydrogenase class IV
MNYHFNMPTKIVAGKYVIKENSELFATFGKKAMLVTGRHSAIQSGAYDEVVSVLTPLGIEWLIFDEIENNPSLETVVRASEIAKENGVDFIIGIGGGSPLDAAKAIAVLSASDINPLDLFLNEFTEVLPIIAIPTTSGTGSEVTPYSVLVRNDLGTKVSFGNQETFPKLALLDYRLTQGLSKKNTINTAIDAFTHVFEGFLSNRATVLSDALALEAIRVFGECLPSLIENQMIDEIREKLMYVSFLGGIVITHTGVTSVHGMGYCYTYYHDIPHGQANAFLLGAYLDYIQDYIPQKNEQALKTLGYDDPSVFLSDIEKLVGRPPHLDDEQITLYTSQSMRQARSMENTAGHVDASIVERMWRFVK